MPIERNSDPHKLKKTLDAIRALRNKPRPNSPIDTLRDPAQKVALQQAIDTATRSSSEAGIAGRAMADKSRASNTGHASLKDDMARETVGSTETPVNTSQGLQNSPVPTSHTVPNVGQKLSPPRQLPASQKTIGQKSEWFSGAKRTSLLDPTALETLEIEGQREKMRERIKNIAADPATIATIQQTAADFVTTAGEKSAGIARNAIVMLDEAVKKLPAATPEQKQMWLDDVSKSITDGSPLSDSIGRNPLAAILNEDQRFQTLASLENISSDARGKSVKMPSSNRYGRLGMTALAFALALPNQTLASVLLAGLPKSPFK